MRKAILLLFALAFVMTAPAADAGETAWFDMENCVFCQHLVKDPKLLENLSWEHHDIKNGAMTISVVKPEYRESYKAAQKEMMAEGQKLQSGEVAFTDVKMCGHCQAYGKLMMMGVKIEYVQGEAADVLLMTSGDPEMVKEIQIFAKHNRDETAKLEKAGKI